MRSTEGGSLEVSFSCHVNTAVLLPTEMDERHMHLNDYRAQIDKALFVLGGTAVLIGLYLLSVHHYLLFHSLAEIAGVTVALTIFMIFWNSRRFMQNGYMLFLGIAYLFVGAFDLIHALAYKGMAVFPGHGTNLPTQLWIVTRYTESLSFLVAPLFLRRKPKVTWVFLSYAAVSCLVLLSIFRWGNFPVCYDNVQNRLTPFKEASEFVIVGILLASLLILLTKRGVFDPRVLKWISWSIVLTMMSELMFTRYTNPYEWTNAVGHLVKLVSFYCVYKALIEIGLREPYNLLYRELKQQETDLQKARDDLEVRVQQRTAQLSHTVEALQEEVKARMRAEQSYRESETKYRALVERVPAITHVFALDETGATLYISPQVEPILGFAPSEYTDSPQMWASRLHPDDRQQVLAEMFRTREPNTPFFLEYRMLTRDGRVLWFRD
jgi:PAS domain S-box-containing protein